jgi:hypothetical protein
MMTDKLEMMWEGLLIAYSRYCPGTWTEEYHEKPQSGYIVFWLDISTEHILNTSYLCTSFFGILCLI